MHKDLLDLLVCPSCRGYPLQLESHDRSEDEILEGALRCPLCGREYPVRGGVPRFVDIGHDYCSNFGFQWKRWKDIQIDRLGGHHLSESRFFSEVPWEQEWMREKLLLDVGCGAGRFADVAASCGAQVVAVDLSEAVDACYETTRIHGDRVQVVQASVYELPFRHGTFDGLYCLGVIQHTPDPRRTMESLPVFLRPGGFLAYDFYQKTKWEKPWTPHFYFRRFTPNWPTRRTLLLSHVLTALFFPLAALLARIPIIRGVLPALPIPVVTDRDLSIRQEYIWTLLDTFDWYGPRYEQRQDFREVARILSRLDLQEVVAMPGVVTGRVPNVVSPK